MFSFLLFFLLAHIIDTPLLAAASSVSVSNPPDSQLPPIAHINSPYSWALAPGTFQSMKNASLIYSATSLPEWLSFDPVTRTFSGTPKPDDEGTHRIKVSATDPETSDSASASFSLCVASRPPPVLSTPVSSQFKPNNPSLASVFVLSDDNSALQRTEFPTLRIPPHWSFSIGFDGDTFTGPDIVGYDVLLEDGSPLPYWMNFNPNEITLTGVTPLPYELSAPYLSLALHALDQSSFSSGFERFDVVITAHEVHMYSHGLPKINITSSDPLDVSLNSPAFVAGVFVDNAPLDLQDLVSLEIDVSPYDWLHYDERSRRLTGQPSNDCSTWDGADLSAVLTTTFNQSLHTHVKLACVPSFFPQDILPAISAAPGKDVYFNLTPFCSSATQDVNLTASYVPAEASSFLHFDTASAILSGSIPPSGKLDYSLVTVSFSAYSPVTHSTSHSSLPISLNTTRHEYPQPTTTPSFRVSRKKLALGLGIALALSGGLLVLGLILAALRCLARPPDETLTGAAATRAMTESDRRWYGIGDGGQTEDRGDSAEKGYNAHANGRWGELGIGLSRTMTATSSNDERTLASPGQLSKGEFLGRLRSTVRKVSNRYRGARKSAIGRPVLVLSASDPRVLGTPAIPALAGYEPMGYSGIASSLHGSPSSSSGERSIPQRRADFAPPRVPAPVAAPTTSRSLDSDVSLASDSSTRSHATEAVVQRATRARSISGRRRQSRADHDGALARVVPFTASRTPAAHDGETGPGSGVPSPARASSLSASVMRVVAPSGGGGSASEVDELHVGLHYVRALGEDARDGSGSFSSVESSHPARSSIGSGGAGRRIEVLRVLVRVGERFRFRLPVRAGASVGGLTARRVSGELLPAFLYADLDVARGDKHRDTVKFWGVPRADDVGTVHVGVYTANGECVAEAVIEVLIRSS
jgi:axial budding pattern protein 2